MNSLLLTAVMWLVTQHVAAPAPTPTAASAIAGVELHGGVLGWQGIRLGAKRRAVERRLARRLVVSEDPDVPACGAFRSAVLVAGTNVQIQWSGASADATVESIVVPLSESEAALSLDECVARIGCRSRALRLVGTRAGDASAIGAAEFEVAGNPGNVILLKGAPEHLLFISLEGCLD